MRGAAVQAHDAHLFALVRGLRLLMRTDSRTYALTREAVGLYLYIVADRNPPDPHAREARELAQNAAGGLMPKIGDQAKNALRRETERRGSKA